jgi:hypothetical protein
MAGYFSRMFDLPSRPSFFGAPARGEDGSSDDDAADQRAPGRPFFAPDSALFLGALNAPDQYFGSLAAPPMHGMSDTSSARPVMSVVADFGPRGRAHADIPYWTGPFGLKDTDPRMPFFVLPPNAIFNMPIIKQLPGTPYAGKDGLHLDGWNPWERRVISPGPGI